MAAEVDSPPREFHNCIVYVDESGDHGPASPEYPIFVLAFCVFEKKHYAEDVTTAVQKLKFRYFGNDAVVLHERDIRKQQRPFQFLTQKELRQRFMDDLNQVILDAQFTLIAAAIKKDAYGGTDHIYHMAMQFGLERLAYECDLGADSPMLHLVCESRGRREDDELELAFRRICQGNNWHSAQLRCDIVFAGKERCHAGMEIADLVARPIGRHILRPDQPNRAWEILKQKFRRGPQEQLYGFGLKVFP